MGNITSSRQAIQDTWGSIAEYLAAEWEAACHESRGDEEEEERLAKREREDWTPEDWEAEESLVNEERAARRKAVMRANMQQRGYVPATVKIDGQHGGKREGAGRPTTAAGQARAQAKEIHSAIHSAIHLDPCLQVGSPYTAELYDAMRIVAHMPHRLRYSTDGAWLSGDNGLWTFADQQNSRVISDFRSLLDASRRAYAADAAQAINDFLAEIDPDDETEITADDWLTQLNTSSRYVACALRTLTQEQHRFANDIESINSTHFGRRRVIPFRDGTGVDMASGATLDTDALREALVPDLGWDIPPTATDRPSSLSRNLDAILDGHFGKELIEITAAGLRPLDKTVRAIIAAQTDWGKTTWIEVLKHCFPGAVFIDAKSSSITQNNFSQDTAPLASNLYVFYDEIDKGKDITVGWINQLTSLEYSVELKGEDRREATRVGAPYLIGATFPGMSDPDGQGINSRLDQVYEATSTDQLTPEQRKLLFENTDYIRQLLIWSALNPDRLAGDTLRATAKEATEKIKSNLALALGLVLYPAPKTFTTTASIIASLQELAEEDPGAYDHEDMEIREIETAIGKLLTQKGTRLHAADSRKMTNATQQRGYKGVKLIVGRETG